MAQGMLRANAIIFFLCFVVCGVLIGSALWRTERGSLGDEGEDSRSSETGSVDILEVVEVRANKQ